MFVPVVKRRVFQGWQSGAGCRFSSSLPPRREPEMAVQIRGEMRAPENTDSGEPELWVNLGDVLTWLDDLPNHTQFQVAVDVAGEIRQALYGCAVQGMDDDIARMPEDGVNDG
jgi:hypothetical protein